MSLETFWPHSFDNMGRTQKTRDKKDVPPAPSDSLQDGDPPPGFDALGDLDPAMAKAFEAMTANIVRVIDEKLSPLSETVRQHAEEIKAAGVRLDEAEARILASEDSAAAHESRIVQLEKQISVLSEKVDMAENYSRRLNIRLIGLAEGMETNQPVNFFESWLPQFLKIPSDTGRIKLERAHRALAPRPDHNKVPRPLLLRFHAFQEKQRVMDAARCASRDGPLVFNGSRLSFYNDFSSSVMKRRKAFDVVKRQLRDQGISYGMLYPAILQVSHNGTKKRCTTPAEVAEFLSSIKT